jgi:tetratricopeptide (TPR) repeat protein
VPDVAARTGSVVTDRQRIRDFWELFRTATTQRIGGQAQHAADAYARALELNPDHEDALYYLGNLRFDLGDLAGAERAWRRLAAVNPASSRAHSQLGALHLCLEENAPFDLDAAEAEFRLAHEINKEETGPLLHLGEAALMRGDWAAAGGYLDAVLGSHPASATAHFYAGYLAWKTGHPDRAEEAFRRAVAVTKQPEPPTGVRGEGDTKVGTTPMLSRRERCGELRDLSANLGGLRRTDLVREMANRYRALEGLLVVGRRRSR